MNTSKQIGLIIALMVIMSASCAAYAVIELPIRAEDQTEWHSEQSIERGALLYANNCRTCHGIRGEGFVGPPLNTAEFKNQDPLVLASNRALLQRTLACGRAATLMPAWLNTNGGSLNIRQLGHLVNLITAPTEEGPDGVPVSWGWDEAVHFAHVLNHETALVVGGDTLVSIARGHDVGAAEILALNPNLRDPFAFLPVETIVRLPASNGAPERDYLVETGRENIHRISDSEFVGAMILADLNGIPYVFDAEEKTFVIGGLEGVSEAEVGLYPGAPIQLPDGAIYVLRADDTIDRIAELHNTSAAEILDLNRDVASTNDTAAPLEVRNLLTLPNPATYIVREGDTVTLVEQNHNLPTGSLAEADITMGARITLPEDSVWVVGAQDTLSSVATIHDMEEAELAELNGLEPGTPIRPEAVFALPEGTSYAVQGALIPDIVATLGGVTDESLAAAQDPPVEPDHVYAIGTTLHMPEDAYGSAPPDAKNPGTACVEHAVTATDFDLIISGGSSGPPAAPEEISTDVIISAGATDWTVEADGTTSEPNVGAVKIEVGTTILFTNREPALHTVTVAGETEVPNFGPGLDAEYRRTFEEAGTFEITCDLHSQMTAWVFVE